MTTEEQKTHDQALKIIEALKYRPFQTAAAMKISAKAVQQKTQNLTYNKFNTKNLRDLIAFLDEINQLKEEIKRTL